MTAAAAVTPKGVLRPHEGRSYFHLTHLPVAPVLDPFVERYWCVRWDLSGRPPYRSQVLPHPSVTVSVETGDGERHGHALPAGLVHGVVTRRFEVDLVGAGRVFGITFRAGGFAAFTGEPGRTARDAVLPVGILGDRWAELARVLLALDDDGDRAGAADELLSRWAPPVPERYARLLDLLPQLVDDRTITRVEQVSELAGLSPRSLQRLFHRFVGVGPKRVLCRYRLHDAAAALDAGTASDLAELASTLGWFDQAHFSRDFRDAVGATPSEYLAAARQAASARSPVPAAR